MSSIPFWIRQIACKLGIHKPYYKWVFYLDMAFWQFTACKYCMKDTGMIKLASELKPLTEGYTMPINNDEQEPLHNYTEVEIKGLVSFWLAEIQIKSRITNDDIC